MRLFSRIGIIQRIFVRLVLDLVQLLFDGGELLGQILRGVDDFFRRRVVLPQRDVFGQLLLGFANVDDGLIGLRKLVADLEGQGKLRD